MGHFFCAMAVNGNILGAASSTGIVYAVFCGTFYFQAVVYIIEVGGVAAFICFVGTKFTRQIPLRTSRGYRPSKPALGAYVKSTLLLLRLKIKIYTF